MSLRELLARTPVVGRASMVVYRAGLASRYLSGPLANAFYLLFRSKETTNFTYQLAPRNVKHLAAFVSVVAGCSYDEAVGYIAEVEGDNELRSHISTVTAKSEYRHTADTTAYYGRRIGWYAIARVGKPKVTVETGVDKGLGACILTAALRRNAEEGHEGKYYGVDIDPKAGYLLRGDYAEHGEVVYADSLEFLRTFDGVVDFFINDSAHTEEHEGSEYRMVSDKLSPASVVIGDNAHGTDELLEFAQRTGRRFLYFQEKPHAHWYPGGGIGAAFVTTTGSRISR